MAAKVKDAIIQVGKKHYPKTPRDLKYTVFVVGGNFLVSKMFKDKGHTITTDRAEAELFVFTGGEDVFPLLYGQRPLKSTAFNIDRDMKERLEYEKIGLKTPKLGICRGGQFLNVLSGGSMWQHVDGHDRGPHKVLGFDGNEVSVTSTHHQMMRPHPDAWVMAEAQVSSFREDEKVRSGRHGKTWPEMDGDPEVVYYAETNSLCFQPHPEYKEDGGPCREMLFDYMGFLFHDDIWNKRIMKGLVPEVSV